MFPVQLQSERLLLRELETTDEAAMAAWIDDPEATRYVPDASLTEGASGWLRRAITEAERSTRDSYQLAVDHQNETVGVGLLSVDSQPDGRGEIGFAVAADYWHSGFGGEICGALIAFGFGDLNLHRLWAACCPGNDASQAILERHGFVLEGRLRDDVVVGGRWDDSLIYGLLVGDG